MCWNLIGRARRNSINKSQPGRGGGERRTAGRGGIKPPSEPANQPGLVAGGVVEADREEEGGLFRINTTTDI